MREASGARWDALELNAWLSTAAITDTPHDTVAALAGFAGVSTAEVLDSPIVLVGSESEIAERLRQRRERWGYSYVCVQGPQLVPFAGLVQRLAEH